MSNTTEVTSGYVPVEGGELYYEVSGSGHALVLIHAGVADCRQWDEQVPVFGAHYQVIRYDTRGFGKTRSEAVSFSNRQDLYDLLQHLGVAQATVLGNSRGGQIAVDFALEHPEMVAALIPIAAGLSGFEGDPAGAPPYETEAFEAMEEAWAKRDLDRLDALELQMWVDGPGQPEGRVAGAVRQRMREMIHANNSRQEPEPTARPLDPAAAGRLSEIHVPTLVIVGDLDTSSELAASEALARGIPGAQKVVFPGVAHMVNLEQPERFNQVVLDFLAGVHAQPASPAAD